MIVLKSSLVYGIPIVENYGEFIKIKNNKNLKFKFFFEIRNLRVIELALEMINENVKKYRITASGFLGELLQFICDNCPDKN